MVAAHECATLADNYVAAAEAAEVESDDIAYSGVRCFSAGACCGTTTCRNYWLGYAGERHAWRPCA